MLVLAFGVYHGKGRRPFGEDRTDRAERPKQEMLVGQDIPILIRDPRTYIPTPSASAFPTVNLRTGMREVENDPTPPLALPYDLAPLQLPRIHPETAPHSALPQLLHIPFGIWIFAITDLFGIVARRADPVGRVGMRRAEKREGEREVGFT